MQVEAQSRDPALPASDAPKTSGTRPFARFEWALAMRYLRARRSRYLPSVIAAISFISIMVAVATLIVVALAAALALTGQWTKIWPA